MPLENKNIILPCIISAFVLASLIGLFYFKKTHPIIIERRYETFKITDK